MLWAKLGLNIVGTRELIEGTRMCQNKLWGNIFKFLGQKLILVLLTDLAPVPLFVSEISPFENKRGRGSPLCVTEKKLEYSSS